MAGRIYVVDDSERLRPMNEQSYDTEELLQKLLAQFPDLLSADGDGSWLLVAREYAVPDQEGGSGRWSLDHLFLDAEGVPTLVEVKRSSDTRLRREVVGQMLDYAANGVAWWPVEQIQEAFRRRCESVGTDPDEELERLLGPDGEPKEFWKQVSTNLQLGRIRMIFVADAIPPELSRVIEFLNGQMNPAEVLGIEVPQFVGEGIRALVPRVVGRTAETDRKKDLASTRTTLNEEDLLAGLADGPNREALRRLFDHVRGLQGLVVPRAAAVSLRFRVKGRKPPVSIAWYAPPGTGNWTGIEHLVLGYEPGSSVAIAGALKAALEEYVERVATLPGAQPFPKHGIRGVTVPTEVIPEVIDQVLQIVTWVHERLSAV